MLITAITPQKLKKDRVNIFIDNHFVFATDLEIVFKRHLKVNQEMTELEISEYVKESEYAKWFNKALEFLSSRPRSKKEIQYYLKRKKVGEVTLQMVIDQLIAKKFIDDWEFAKWFVEQRVAFRPKSKRLIAMELTEKGIAKDTIEEVLEQIIDKDAELTQAKQIARKKMRSFSRYSPDEKKQKVQHFLMRRGYSWEIIRQVLQTLT